MGEKEEQGNPTRKLTKGILWVVVIGLAGYDFWPGFFDPAPGDTISEVSEDWGTAHPFWAFGLGAIMGHFFNLPFGLDQWGAKLRQKLPWSPFALAGVGALVATADFAGWLPSMHPGLSFLVGFPMGALLWSQVEVKNG